MAQQIFYTVLVFLSVVVTIRCPPIKCVEPEVADYNGEECIRPLSSSCTDSKQCSTNAHCVDSICVCVNYAKPMDDKLSCEFAYTEDETLIDAELSKFTPNPNYMDDDSQSDDDWLGIYDLYPDLGKRSWGANPKKPGGIPKSPKSSCSHIIKSLKIWTVLMLILVCHFAARNEFSDIMS